MAYSPKVAKIVSALDYKMIVLDEISYQGGKEPKRNQLFSIRNSGGLVAVFRERRVSNCIMSAVIRSQKEFQDLIKKDLKKQKYLCTAMDGETFGHHRPGLTTSLFKILDCKNPKQIFFSELPKYFKVKDKISPVKSTWASTEADINRNIQFYSWKDPKNKVHQLQWRFLNYVLKMADNKKVSGKVEDKIDRAMASDQFFWASGEPWWSIEMIEKGAWTTLSALKSLPQINKSQIEKGNDYYKDILALAFQYQRSGKIEALAQKYRQVTKIPFKERTLEKKKPEVYYVFLDMMKRKMKEASKKKNFERAILWRDAIWKLETKNDIYDAIHAVDLLRLEVSDTKLTELMDRYKKKYKNIKPGQPEPRKAS
jgi:hypothetical protein